MDAHPSHEANRLIRSAGQEYARLCAAVMAFLVLSMSDAHMWVVLREGDTRTAGAESATGYRYLLAGTISVRTTLRRSADFFCASALAASFIFASEAYISPRVAMRPVVGERQHRIEIRIWWPRDQLQGHVTQSFGVRRKQAHGRQGAAAQR